MDEQKAIDYFFRKMEAGLIESDEQQEVFEIAIKALEKQILTKPIKDNEV